MVARKAHPALKAFAAFGAKVGVRHRRIAKGQILEELVDLSGLGRLEARRIIGEQPHLVGDLPHRAEFRRNARAVLSGSGKDGKQRIVARRQIVPVEAQRRIKGQRPIGDSDLVTDEQARRG